MLKNAVDGSLAIPKKVGSKGAKVLSGTRPWISAPVPKGGVVDEGILALDLDAWL